MKYQVGDIIRVKFLAFNNPYGIIVNIDILNYDNTKLMYSKLMYHVVVQGKPEKVLYLHEYQLDQI